MDFSPTDLQRALREEVLALCRRFPLEWWAERAAIREVDGGQSREDAEREAFDEVREMLEQRKGPRSTLPAPVSIKKREEPS